MQAAILSIGDELVLGQTVDTNAAWLSARLAERGVMTRCHLTVADHVELVTEAFVRVSRDADLVIVTGGLGPTDDDVTREALAAAMGVEQELNEEALTHIRQMFESRGRMMAERNAVQAMRPIGSETLHNPAGTAPGIRATLGDAVVFVFPGVPHEMRTMYDLHVSPALPEQTGRVILSAKINTFGAGESTVAELIADQTHRSANPIVGTTVADGIVSVRVRSEFATVDETRSQLDATIAAVEAALGPLVFSRDDESLALSVGRLLRERGKTLATAESCTAGLVGKMMTDEAGSSDYYVGGWVVYSNALKHSQLGVPSDVLEQHGAVSEPVALALAEGARERADADFALAITGIAGPGGGSDEKPVGTVWIALADRGAPTIATRHVFIGDRDMVRDRSAKTALNKLRVRLIGAES
ncbi:MAG: competence/damage-inducible protein A [Phycisphaera sp.]|nr:competence/damage-inducible protein A [Phycisphaera sp.]